jgi:hypothetical protein
MPPNVTAAQFRPADDSAPGGPWALCISAQGDGFEERALPLQATVGSVPVELIVQSLDGNGFHGCLASTPAEGDVLSVGYEELVPTPVVFHVGGQQ